MKNVILFILFTLLSITAYGSLIQPMSGSHLAEGNRIEWKIDQVDNIQFFIVQSSLDGINFQTVATVMPNKLLTYSFIDKKANSNISYYRIIKVDKKGNGELSQSIELD